MKHLLKYIFLFYVICINWQYIYTNNLDNNFFVIIIPSYNNKDWYKKNLDSVFRQTYKNYRVVYIDDCSSDDTGNLVDKYINNLSQDLSNKIQLIRNKDRKLALENLYITIHSCKSNEIVVTLDGDDWLANENVLTHLNNIYSDKNVWLTYGQFIEYPNNAKGRGRELPKEVINSNNYRSYDWVTTHLRTFYAGLFHKIKKEDLLYENKFYPMTWDVAMLYPMLEMAGNHSKFIPEILYVYNTQTPLNDRKVNKDLQCNLFSLIRSKNKYDKIDSLFEEKTKSEKKFVILVPSYNNSKYYKQNLDSIFKQNYPNYRIIYIDDCSPDNTANLVEKYINQCNQQNRSTLIKNKKRQLALANIYTAALSCEDDEIIVIVDGDDELASDDVLSKLNQIYKNENVWITYGNFKYLGNNSPCDYDPTFPEHIIKENKFREHPHGLTHLRTFYAWLFKQIKLDDLFYEDAFYKMTYDVAIFTPLIEMACERHKFIPDILYIYNNTNPISDDRVSKNLQHNLNAIIRKKSKYQRLDKQQSGFLDTLDNSKTDLIIFPNEVDNIQQQINLIKNNILNINKVFIVYESHNEKELKDYENLKNDFNDFIFIDKRQLNKNFLNQIFINLFDNGSEYIMFLSNKILDAKCNASQLIKILEMTKIFSIYAGKSNDSYISKYLQQNYVEIIKNVYPFTYEKSKLLDLIDLAVYRKKDIDIKQYNSFEKIEIEWKYMGWNKVCLFNFLNQ